MSVTTGQRVAARMNVRRGGLTVEVLVGENRAVRIRQGEQEFSPGQARLLPAFTGEAMPAWMPVVDGIEAALAADSAVTPQAVVAFVRRSEDQRVDAAKSPHSPAWMQAVLAHDPARRVRTALVKTVAGSRRPAPGQRVPPRSLVEVFAQDGEREVLIRLGEALDGHPDVLEDLARHENHRVRSAVAKNPHAPEELLLVLAADKHRSPRLILARRQDASEALMEALCADPDQDVRAAAVSNAACPWRLVQAAVTDRRAVVRAAAVHTGQVAPELLGTLSRDPSELVRLRVAGLRFLPEDLADVLAADAAPKVAALVATRPEITEALIRKLAKHRLALVRVAVATRAGLPDDVTQALLEDQAKVVREAVGGRVRSRRFA